MKLLCNSLPLRNCDATPCMYGCASSSRLQQPPPSPPLALPLIPPPLTTPSNWRNKSQNSCRFVQTHQNLANSRKSLPEISSPQDLTENKHTHIQRETQRHRERETKITKKNLTRNLKPTRTYRNKQTHTQREKQQQKSFLRSHKPNQPKFLPKISSPQDLTVINTHTHKEKKNNKRLSFAPTKPNQPNFLRQISSPQDLTRKKIHTHTHHPNKKNKNKSLSFPPTQPNQIKPKTRSSTTEEKIDSKQLLYKLGY